MAKGSYMCNVKTGWFQQNSAETPLWVARPPINNYDKAPMRCNVNRSYVLILEEAIYTAVVRFHNCI